MNSSEQAPPKTVLQWSSVQKTDAYEVEVATDGVFSEVVMRDSSVSGTSRVLEGLRYSKKYFWHVRGKHGSVVGAYSPTEIFVTNTPPVADAVLCRDGVVMAPWSDARSLSASRTYASTDPSYQGRATLKVASKPGASLQFTQATSGSAAPFDPCSYSSLQFAVHGGTRGVSLQLRCVDGFGKAVGSMAIVQAQAGVWSTVSIPMAQLAAKPFVALTMSTSTANTTYSLAEIVIVANQSSPVASSVNAAAAEPEAMLAYDMGSDNTSEVPADFGLSQNYPNPFNPETRIRYSLAERAAVRVTVFELTGREVASLVQGEESGGTHEVRFRGAHLASGTYIYRLTAVSQTGKTYSEVRKMTLLK
jgi:hypothetical protein